MTEVGFSEALEDWVDWDQAAYELGLSLGVLTADVPFSKSKRIFWEDNPAGRALHATLLALVEAGLLESRNDYEEFRWVSTTFLNVFDD
ncbi:hypothetical protein G6045_05910 [Streptomyces sp. YC504]|uniref:Uncharacterized protein n=1 Tax=Streptomyces mesophilus TaxID=1775132 RepID=A0A6G4XCU8_9ACTN|nr:hypothetical protein [Streptomyces mesophilus]NGO75218.1 hypothetical protein [Streptomyces mesophilus]